MDGHRQIHERALFEEVGAEACIRAEHQMALAVHVAGIQVRNGHWGSTDGGLAVHFGVVLRGRFGIAVAEEEAGNRKAAVAFAFGDTGFLQQGQCAAACAEEDETGAECQRVVIVFGAAGFQHPCAVRFAVEVVDMTVEFDFYAFVAQVFDHLAGQAAEIDVRAFGGVVGGDGLVFIAAVDDQRRPFGDFGTVGRKLHFFEEFLVFEHVETFLQIIAMIGVHHQRHMGNGIDESAVGQFAFFDQARPKLAADVELFGNIEGAGRIDRTVGSQGSIVQFAQGRVSRTGVVPCI